MAFAIKRLALISIHFCPSFFLLQLNLTYMKGILHLVPVKIIIRMFSYNKFKIDLLFTGSKSFKKVGFQITW